jgi:hypothetical protein
VEGRSYDEFTAGVPTHIPAHYTTPWFDMNQPAVIKMFRAPHIVFRGAGDDVATISVYRDYDSGRPAKSFTEPVSVPSGAMVWGSSLWNANPPINTTEWAGLGSEHVVQRGVPLGRARAVQLRIDGPESNIDWGLDAISLVYNPRKVR